MDTLFHPDQTNTFFEQVVRILVLLATRESCFSLRDANLTFRQVNRYAGPYYRFQTRGKQTQTRPRKEMG